MKKLLREIVDWISGATRRARRALRVVAQKLARRRKERDEIDDLIRNLERMGDDIDPERAAWLEKLRRQRQKLDSIIAELESEQKRLLDQLNRLVSGD